MATDHLAGANGGEGTDTNVVERTFELDMVGGRLMCGHFIVAYLAGSILDNPAIAAAAQDLVDRHKAYPKLVAALQANARLWADTRDIALLRELGELK